eukprot:scaffold36392_cov30-Tisochrysis_lutea.AAC.2
MELAPNTQRADCAKHAIVLLEHGAGVHPGADELVPAERFLAHIAACVAWVCASPRRRGPRYQLAHAACLVGPPLWAIRLDVPPGNVCLMGQKRRTTRHARWCAYGSCWP